MFVGHICVDRCVDRYCYFVSWCTCLSVISVLTGVLTDIVTLLVGVLVCRSYLC